MGIRGVVGLYSLFFLLLRRVLDSRIVLPTFDCNYYTWADVYSIMTPNKDNLAL